MDNIKRTETRISSLDSAFLAAKDQERQDILSSLIRSVEKASKQHLESLTKAANE